MHPPKIYNDKWLKTCVQSGCTSLKIVHPALKMCAQGACLIPDGSAVVQNPFSKECWDPDHTLGVSRLIMWHVCNLLAILTI